LKNLYFEYFQKSQIQENSGKFQNFKVYQLFFVDQDDL
jgi:hypothetical protein